MRLIVLLHDVIQCCARCVKILIFATIGIAIHCYCNVNLAKNYQVGLRHFQQSSTHCWTSGPDRTPGDICHIAGDVSRTIQLYTSPVLDVNAS